MKIEHSKSLWLERAELLKPALNRQDTEACAVVFPVTDSAAWQGVRMRREPLEPFLAANTFASGGDFTVELPESTVGRVRFSVEAASGYPDSPVRLRLVFGETPFEITGCDQPFDAILSRSWLQDETFTLDDLPGEFTLPRRYSCRYIQFQVLNSPGALRFRGIGMVAESSADLRLPPPPAGIAPEFAAIDEACMRTLRNCMQTTFEDGPKRDRRLWVGDLRLQAMINQVSYRRYDLVERSLYLLAGCAAEDGRIPGCVFEHPRPGRGCDMADYSLLFAVTLEEHCRWSGNDRTGHDLFDIAAHQFALTRKYVGADGIIDPEKISDIWHFIDHDRELNTQASLQGIYITGLRSLERLARRLGRPEDATRCGAEAAEMTAAARKRLIDPQSGAVVSGPARQLSCASQAWAILAGILTPEEGKRALELVLDHAEAVMPKSPYLYHYLVESCFLCGQETRGVELIRSYWGEMLRLGADTFWEVFVPERPFFSPYRDARLNSACHAWSCTPAYFLRTRPECFREIPAASAAMVSHN